MEEQQQSKIESIDIKKQIDQIFAENQKLQYVKSRTNEVLEKLKVLRTEINNIIQLIDPTVKISVGNRQRQSYGKRGAFKEMLDELYGKMQSGLHVTKDLIVKTYPECAYPSDVMWKLGKMPNVKKVKDGIALRLYI